ncbi:RDD family protein [Epidermidibacterium keratini]|uniref:RDD family protein n=1 Tax=Epidermidibacterium keratini TaxID=1891644 RepID=A0A7L4YK18_9ACTN|nr:RDD family protein [Epidermidibacterium keratini]QHB99232.1 RDD family protein [Epidermidibacterium keratini]
MPTTYPGSDLGLPESGPGSLATIGARVGAVVIDCLIAGLLTWPFTAPELPRNWSLIGFFVLYVATTWWFGRTPGMMLTGLRLGVEGKGQSLGLLKAVVRTVLLMLLLPAVLMDGNRRGFHDKAAGTVVVTDR